MILLINHVISYEFDAIRYIISMKDKLFIVRINDLRKITHYIK